MKNAALLSTLLGLLLISMIILFQKPIPVFDYNQLNSLEENTLVKVYGNITNFYSYSKKYLIKLDNNISCIVDSVPLNRNHVSIVGMVQKYQGKSSILSLAVSNDN